MAQDLTGSSMYALLNWFSREKKQKLIDITPERQWLAIVLVVLITVFIHFVIEPMI